MNRSFTAAIVGLPLLVALIARPASAAQLSAEDCRARTRPCTCSDAQFMEVFLKNQQDSRDAWKTVYDFIGSPSGPTTGVGAKAAHDAIFPGDPRVLTEYKKCPSYDPNADVSQFAGAPGPGQLWVDSCACEAFCSDIIEATIKHESSHPPTIILGAANYSIDMVMCAAGVEAKSLCDQIEPNILAVSELIAYTLGNNSLESAIDKLGESPDPAKPTELCTWQTIAAAPPPPNEAAPRNLWARLMNLADRFWNGVIG